MIKTQDYIRDFITMIFVRISLIIGITLIFAITAILIAFLWPPTYSARGSILLKSTRALKIPESLEDIRLDVPVIRENDLNSEMKIITSYNVIENTIKSLQNRRRIFHKSGSSSETIKKLVWKIQRNLTAELSPRSNVFDIVLEWKDRKEAENILETLMNEYLDYRASLYSPVEAQAFFKKQLEIFNKNLIEMENNLIRLAEDSNSTQPTREIENNLLMEKTLETSLNETRNRWIEQKNYVNYLEGTINSKGIHFFTFIDNVEIGNFSEKLQNLILERESLLKIYQPDSKKIRMLERHINDMYQALKTEVKLYIEDQKAKLYAMEKTMDSLEERLRKFSSKNIALYRNLVETRRINREIGMLEDSYITFAKRWEEARIESTTDSNRLFAVNILSKAQAAKAPVFPNKNTLIPIGIILGLLFGFAIGFLLEFFDHTFKRPEDAMTYADLPHICSIPRW